MVTPAGYTPALYSHKSFSITCFATMASQRRVCLTADTGSSSRYGGPSLNNWGSQSASSRAITRITTVRPNAQFRGGAYFSGHAVAIIGAHTNVRRAAVRFTVQANHHRRHAPNYQVGNCVWLSTRDIWLCLSSIKLSPRFIGLFVFLM